MRPYKLGDVLYMDDTSAESHNREQVLRRGLAKHSVAIDTINTYMTELDYLSEDQQYQMGRKLKIT